VLTINIKDRNNPTDITNNYFHLLGSFYQLEISFIFAIQNKDR